MFIGGADANRLGALAAALVLALAPLPARAERDSAAASFDEGPGHYRRKAFTQAAHAFLRAYHVAPSGDAAYNAGLSFELAGTYEHAATAYTLALGQAELGPEAAADAKSRLGKLARALGRVEISAPAAATIQVPPFALPGPNAVAFFEPGRHRVRIALANGAEVVRTVQVGAGETAVVLVESETARSRPEPVRRERPRQRAGESEAAPYQTAGFISLGVAAFASGAAIYVGLQTLRARDDYDASGHRDATARDRAKRYMLWTNISWATAGVAAAGGLGLILLSPSEPAQHSALGWPRGVAVSGRFE